MNKEKTYFIYTDASFDKKHELAVIGYAYFYGFDNCKPEDLEINLLQISEKNNVRAELRAAIAGLSVCAKNSKVILYSDCKAVTELPRRRKKLEEDNFISKSKGSLLSNADLYKDFYKLIYQLDLEIYWTKGHKPNKNLDTIQTNFGYLDKFIRKELRLNISMLNKK